MRSQPVHPRQVSFVSGVVLLLSCLPLMTSGQCAVGRFGRNCQHYCHCAGESACDVTTGVCATQCAEGYLGPACQAWNAALGSDIRDDAHGLASFIFDGKRSTCIRQKKLAYTVQLESSAPLDKVKLFGMIYFLFESKPENSEAMNVTVGDQQCRTSFGGDKSMSEVSVSCQDAVSDTFSFHFTDGFHLVTRLCEIEVLVCTSGFFGEYCQEECGRCRGDVSCHQVSGNCSSGCAAGYTGSQCFDTCPNGTYGWNCALDCGMCSENTTCHHVTGNCADGCAEGWRGLRCDERCQWGTYGQDCAQRCRGCEEEGMCHHVTGQCLTVAEEPDLRDVPLPREVKEAAPLLHGPSLGAGMVLAVCLALLATGVVCYLKRRLYRGTSPRSRLHPPASSLPNLLAPPRPSRPPLLPDLQSHYETPLFNSSGQTHGSYDSLDTSARPGAATSNGTSNLYEGPITCENANVYEELPERQPRPEESSDPET